MNEDDYRINAIYYDEAYDSVGATSCCRDTSAE